METRTSIARTLLKHPHEPTTLVKSRCCPYTAGWFVPKSELLQDLHHEQRGLPRDRASLSPGSSSIRPLSSKLIFRQENKAGSSTNSPKRLHGLCTFDTLKEESKHSKRFLVRVRTERGGFLHTLTQARNLLLLESSLKGVVLDSGWLEETRRRRRWTMIPVTINQHSGRLLAGMEKRFTSTHTVVLSLNKWFNQAIS